MKDKCYSKEMHEKLVNLVDWNFYHETSDLVKKVLLVFSAGTLIYLTFPLHKENLKFMKYSRTFVA